MRKNSSGIQKIKIIASKGQVAGYVFISPWLIGFISLTLAPMLISLYLSFTNYNLVSAPVFIGLGNFQRMAEDPRFIKSFFVTIYYVFVSVPLKVAFALFVAFLLNKRLRVMNFYRSVYYLPSLIGGSIAVAMMWKELFANDNGILNSALKAIGMKSDIAWLGNPKTAIWTLIVLTVWQFGSSMIIFAAGLKQIPESYYEAAKIDGALTWHTFRYITIPSLSPIIFFNLIMQMISGFMAFTQSYIVTKGGPLDSTLFYALYVYRRAFEFFDMGYGSAMSWVLLVIIAIFTSLIFKSSSSWVYYESKGEM